MNRREFLKVIGLGSMTLFVSGCGLSATANNEQSTENTPEPSSVSGGKSMKIVLINSSPHSESESTSRYLAQKF
ncbi:MAG: flavodoxin family protein, partial [Selenomonadaceae bacterium]|nr:flavodoxin family protein [Selenomonadaceae bacterium]